LPLLNKDTKAWQILCRPCEAGRPGAEAGILVADERRYSVGPQLLEAGVVRSPIFMLNYRLTFSREE